MRLLLLTVALGLLSASSLSAADWTQWRGPNHNNVADRGQTVPTTWGATKNVAWKVSVPGRGHSSPIAVGDLIVLTSADEQGQQQGEGQDQTGKGSKAEQSKAAARTPDGHQAAKGPAPKTPKLDVLLITI